jgi:hypothetical protein
MIVDSRATVVPLDNPIISRHELCLSHPNRSDIIQMNRKGVSDLGPSKRIVYFELWLIRRTFGDNPGWLLVGHGCVSAERPRRKVSATKSQSSHSRSHGTVSHDLTRALEMRRDRDVGPSCQWDHVSYFTRLIRSTRRPLPLTCWPQFLFGCHGQL